MNQSRKILNNYRKSKRLNGNQKGKIGSETPLIDKNGRKISVGDSVRYGDYKGIFLFNPSCGQYGVALDHSMWYGDDKYDINSYGKFVSIPHDNGARMEVEIIDEKRSKT